MATYSGTLEDSSSAVSVKLTWSSTASGSMDFYLEVATDGYGTRSSCWYWVAINGSRIVDKSISITGGGYHYAWSKYGYSAPVGSSGILSSIDIGFGYDSETYGTKEATAAKYNIQVADANYTVYYNYQNGAGGSTYVSGHNTNETHTVISTIPTYSGDYDNTTNFTITGYANGGDGGNRSATASKRTWSTHTFLGWSTSSSATSATYKAGSTFAVTKDITLYGVWSYSSGTTYSNNTLAALGSTTWSTSGTGYTVILNANASTASVSPSTLASGTTTTHDFLGWNTSSTASSALASTTAYTSDTSVYAVWNTEITDNSTVSLPTPTRSNDTSYHTVTLNGNGGTTTTKSIDCPIVTSYSFKGWATTSNASSGITGSYTPTSDVTLYAIWSANSPTYPSVTLPTDGLSRSSSKTIYTTTLNLNGGSHSKTSVTSGITKSYTFSHWSSTTSGSSVGSSISGTTYSTLYAIWTSSTSYNTASLGTPSKSISYKVTFDPSGGTVSPTSRNVTGSYSFLGWYTTNSSSGTKITNPSSYRATSNNTLYAIWGSRSLTGISLPTPTRSAVDGTFTITLNANGGSLSSSITNPITVESKTSFTFAGWSTVSGDSSNIVSNTSNYTTTSACTLYAIWTPDTDTAGIALPTSGVTRSNSVVTSYKITLDPVDGSVDPVSINTNKIRQYTFKGWSPTGSTSNMVSSSSYVPVSDITLKAAYSTKDSVQAKDLPNATKTDHTFLGWTTVEGATNYVATRYTTSGNITLYANYLANYRGSLYIWYNGKWNKCIANLFTGDRFNGAI